MSFYTVRVKFVPNERCCEFYGGFVSFATMKQRIWITLITYLAYCIDKDLYKALDYLKTQVQVFIELQEKQNKRILLTNNQRIRIAAKAKKLSVRSKNI